jgi:hypothetical protein
MISALRVFGRSVGDLWYHIIGYAFCNLVVLLGLVLVIPGPPLLLALLDVATESGRYNERPEVSLLLNSARSRFLAAWRLALVLLLGLLVIGASLYFYGYLAGRNHVWALPLVLLTVCIGWTWLGVTLFSGALLVRSERGALIAIRNGLVLFTHYPFFSSVVLLIAIASTLISIVLAPLIMLVTLSFLAVLATRATAWALRKEGILPPPIDEPEEQPVQF